MTIVTTLKTTAAATVTFAGLGIAAVIVAPEATAGAVNTLQDRIGAVFTPDCETRPVACLRARERELAGLVDTLSTLRLRLDGEQTRSAELAIEADQRLAANRLYLNEGRRILLSAQPGQPLNFLGVKYPTADALRQQLELTFAEGRQLEALVHQYRTTRDEIARARQEIVTNRSEVMAELRIIPSKIALAEVQATSRELRTAINKIDGVMARARHASRAADPLLRSTEELMADATRPATAPSEFDAWLRSPNGG